MAGSFVFDRENLVNLLLNHRTYISKKCREAIANGRDITKIKFSESDVWTEEFIDDEIEKRAIRLEDILDEVDSILEKTHGMTTLQRAKQKIKEDN